MFEDTDGLALAALLLLFYWHHSYSHIVEMLLEIKYLLSKLVHASHIGSRITQSKKRLGTHQLLCQIFEV